MSQPKTLLDHFLSIRPLLIGCLLITAWGCRRDVPQEGPIRIYAGAGLRPALAELAETFKEKTGLACEIDYGGSGLILSRAKEDDQADLFIPGDVWYVDRLDELTSNIQQKTTISYFVPTIIVQSGNPKRIKGLADFARKDISVALGNPKACQIGRLCVKILSDAGLDAEGIPAKLSLTVNELAVWVKMRDVDAAIVWDAIAANVAQDTDMIEIPQEINQISTVVAGLLKTSEHPEAARRLLAFITSPEGERILQDKGYRIAPPYSKE
jgi:molybdate transport system substrate-binding protein